MLATIYCEEISQKKLKNIIKKYGLNIHTCEKPKVLVELFSDREDNFEEYLITLEVGKGFYSYSYNLGKHNNLQEAEDNYNKLLTL